MTTDGETAFAGIDKEVRFAVVMYGGVSLAIYINGVAQELLKMCRATAQSISTRTSTEIVYRQIAQALANPQLLSELQKSAPSDGDEEKTSVTLEKLLRAAETLPAVRLIVDVLSGTSAGGINAVFLAKALAQNTTINSLKDLWIKEGDIGVLINDRQSVTNTDLDAPANPKSLLNSDRMFVKLIEAFQRMSADREAAGQRPPLVDEVDLFVTTTDFRGVVSPIRLMDGVVEERNFRQWFHFRHSVEDQLCDFEAQRDTTLAFASRCTSSFPFAFEPMRLRHALNIVRDCVAKGDTEAKALKEDVPKFLRKVVDKDGHNIDFLDRDFVDGGVLDNKPFSHAISVLSDRRADFQVSRKLLYIEPSPEYFSKKDLSNVGDAPDALTNALGALSSIPGYETIREDLERVIERNTLIDRVNLIVANAEQDVFEQITSLAPSPAEEKKPSDWSMEGLEDVAAIDGRAVLPYYRLRIASVTDEITGMANAILGIEDSSDNFAIVRELIKKWRTFEFKDHKADAKLNGKKTILAFLDLYDANYRLRRLRLIEQKLSKLNAFDDPQYKEQLKNRSEKLCEIRKQHAAAPQHPFVEPDIKVTGTSDLRKALQGESVLKPTEILYGLGESEKFRPQIQAACRYFLSEFAPIYAGLQKAVRDLTTSVREDKRSDTTAQSAAAAAAKVVSVAKAEQPTRKISAADIICSIIKAKSSVLGSLRAAGSDGAVMDLMPDGTLPGSVNDSLKDLGDYYNAHFNKARGEIMGIFDAPAIDGVENVILSAVKDYILHYYNNFDAYDQMSFPIYYEAGVGEAATVDVMRISPLDAKSLIDLSASGETRQKVAGEKLFHFGAFLDGVWRWNDIMWGRLDGAERLVCALLPGDASAGLRKYFTKRLHLEILKEEFVDRNTDVLRSQLAGAIVASSKEPDVTKVIASVRAQYDDEALKHGLETALCNVLSDENKVYDFVKTSYQFPLRPDPRLMLETIGRSTQVTGEILRGIADERKIDGNKFRILARVGQLFWGLVQIAAPNTVWNMLVRQWLFLLYFFELLLIVTSWLLSNGDVEQFGIVLLLLTGSVNLAIVAMHDWMEGKRVHRLLIAIPILIVSILILTGVLAIFAFFFQPTLWERINSLH
jgi:patatin-related protein